ncbi:hypothetical protein GCM10009813_16040 [Brevibacterium marinum]
MAVDSRLLILRNSTQVAARVLFRRMMHVPSSVCSAMGRSILNGLKFGGGVCSLLVLPVFHCNGPLPE